VKQLDLIERLFSPAQRASPQREMGPSTLPPSQHAAAPAAPEASPTPPLHTPPETSSLSGADGVQQQRPRKRAARTPKKRKSDASSPATEPGEGAGEKLRPEEVLAAVRQLAAAVLSWNESEGRHWRHHTAQAAQSKLTPSTSTSVVRQQQPVLLRGCCVAAGVHLTPPGALGAVSLSERDPPPVHTV
jgi:hypothetical protein